MNWSLVIISLVLLILLIIVHVGAMIYRQHKQNEIDENQEIIDKIGESYDF